MFDLAWLTIQRDKYAKMVVGVQRGGPFSVNIWGAITAYAVMFLSLYLIIHPAVSRDSRTSDKLVLSLKHAAVFGFVVYALFNSTNFAIFANYPVSVAIMDTIWGTLVYFVAVYISLLVID